MAVLLLSSMAPRAACSFAALVGLFSLSLMLSLLLISGATGLIVSVFCCCEGVLADSKEAFLIGVSTSWSCAAGADDDFDPASLASVATLVDLALGTSVGVATSWVEAIFDLLSCLNGVEVLVGVAGNIGTAGVIEDGALFKLAREAGREGV